MFQLLPVNDNAPDNYIHNSRFLCKYIYETDIECRRNGEHNIDERTKGTTKEYPRPRLRGVGEQCQWAGRTEAIHIRHHNIPKSWQHCHYGIASVPGVFREASSELPQSVDAYLEDSEQGRRSSITNLKYSVTVPEERSPSPLHDHTVRVAKGERTPEVD
jgi:hypothetical protein